MSQITRIEKLFIEAAPDLQYSKKNYREESGLFSVTEGKCVEDAINLLSTWHLDAIHEPVAQENQMLEKVV